MAFGNGPKIVTNGLVLSLDAADRNSYSGTGTAWNDLSGNGNTGTLTNGPTYSSTNGGSIVFDGTNDRCLTQLPASTIGAICTVVATCTCNSYGVDAQGARRIVSLDRTAGSSKWAIATKSTGGIQFVSGGGNEDGNIFDITIGEIFQVSLVLQNTSYKLYKNGELKINTTFTPDASSFGNVSIGSRPTVDDRFWDGKIFNTIIYNRALSATEVLQNYNALKSRFNLK
jgi:hypothetical protein